jgi:hypothetical protein
MKRIKFNDSFEHVLVGVFLGRKHRSLLEKGKPVERIARLQRANRKAKTNLYFFSIEDVHLNDLTIDGVYFESTNGKWMKKSFPFPQVLYNRGGFPKRQREKWLKFKRALDVQGVKYLNYVNGFNKWEVYEALKKREEVRAYIPFTCYYQNKIDLIRMFNKFDTVYLKACRGRKGYQVMKVSKLDRDQYEYGYFKKNDTVKCEKVDLKTLFLVLEEFFHQKEFIIQEAIDLPVRDHRMIDMRSEVQRNGLGKLEITSICVRVSHEHAPITTHSNSYIFEKFYRVFLNHSTKEIKQQRKRVEVFLTEIYSALESVYGPMGEVGIDFGLDRNNQIWFIECNSKPAKVSLLKAYDEKTIEKAFLNPLEYAKYLHLHRKAQKTLHRGIFELGIWIKNVLRKKE